MSDEYDEYDHESSGVNEGDLDEGYSFYDEGEDPFNDGDDNDLAAAFLNQASLTNIDGSHEGSADNVRDSHYEGKATKQTQAQDYLGRMSPNAQHIMSRMGIGDITGFHVSTNVRLGEAQQRLNKIGGNDVSRFAPSAVTSIDPTGYTPAGIIENENGYGVRRGAGSVEPTRGQVSITGTENYEPSEAVIAQTLSFVEKTIPEMFDRGAGGRLHTNFMDDESLMKHNLEMAQAYAIVDNIADKLYISDRTRESDVYGVRKASVTGELLNHILDKDRSKQGGLIVPLPNEMYTPGLKPTPAMRGGDTAAWNTLEFSQELDNRGINRADLDPKNPYHNQLMRKAGSIDNFLAPIDWSQLNGVDDKDKPEATAQLLRMTNIERNKIKRDIDWATDKLRGDMLSNRDESYGNSSRVIGRDSINGEHSAATEFRNFHSSELSMAGNDEWSSMDGTPGTSQSDGQVDATVYGGDVLDKDGNATDRIGSSRSGSGVQSMYGAKFNSDQETLVQEDMVRYNKLLQLGKSEDEAAAYVVRHRSGDTKSWQRPNSKLNSSQDLYNYEESVRDNNPHKQGSAGWHAEREGLVTASLAPELWKGKGDDRIAVKLAQNKLIDQMPEGVAKETAKLQNDPSNAYMRMGTEQEDKVRDTFLQNEGKGLIFREAFFESGNIEGIGASADGRLFNPDGSSAGLAEFKFLGESGMKGAVKQYTPQMQMQMAETGESQVHFVALDKETNEYHHEIVKADKEMQKELVSLAQSALNKAGKLTTQEGIDKMKAGYKGARRVGSTPSKSGQTAAIDMTPEHEEEMTGFDLEAANAKEGGQASHVVAYRQATGDGDYKDLNKVDAEAGTGGGKKGKSAEEQASIKAAKALEDLAKSAAKANKVMGEMAGAVLGGTESIMNEERAASTAGMSIGDARGARRELQKAGLSESQSAGVISAAGSITNQLAGDPDAVSGLLERLTKAANGPQSSAEMQKLKLPDASEVLGMSTKERIADGLRMVNAVSSDKDKAAIATAWGVPQLATSEGLSAAELLAAFDDKAQGREDPARDTNRGIEWVKQFGQDVYETTSQLGEIAGGAAKVGAGVAAFGGTAVAGVAGSVAIKGAITAGATSMAPAALTATAATAAKGLALTGATVAGSVIAGAGFGYVIGSGINAVVDGTFVGDAIGKGVTHIAAAFGSDEAQATLDRMEIGQLDGIDAVPSTDVDVASVAPKKGSSSSGKVDNINNITTNVVVDPSMVKTTVDVNGDEYNDQELGYAS